MKKNNEEWHANWMGDLNLYAAFFANLMETITRWANTKKKFRITIEHDPEKKTTIKASYIE
ncbi:hypothetical protein [Pectinatus frisingensis]|uniref:hypothetical protein n=1 Tax=Pectinatus frisingensis TaxID=865 RepID=UPI0018C4581E|nr:hypothetical protein [Pectinatus frisingensis]